MVAVLHGLAGVVVGRAIHGKQWHACLFGQQPGLDAGRSARPDAAKKYFMVSADGHANEPANLWAERIDAKYRDRLPRVITDKDGVQWRVSEGHRPDRLRLSTLEGEDQARNKAGADPLGRLADHDLDGIDVELIFPNKGLAMWATPDPQFAMAQCRVWNDWAWEQFSAHQDRMIPAGSLATADLLGSIAEVQRPLDFAFKNGVIDQRYDAKSVLASTVRATP